MIDRITIFTSIEGGKVKRNRIKLAQAFAHFEGKEVEVTIERKKRKRSTQQNRWLWGVAYSLITSNLHDLGTPISAEDVHIMMRMKAADELPFIYEDVVNKETGEVISSRMRSSTEYTTTEMMEYKMFLQAWAAEYLGVDIPDPDEQLAID